MFQEVQRVFYSAVGGLSICGYTAPGKCNRGLMVIGSLRHLAGDRVLTEEEERKALILGWCIEWVGTV